MSDTRDKLNESKYFLDQMKVNVESKDGFRYNLSAFMSALRSTTLFMQAEYTHTPGFLNWYATVQADMEKDKLLKFFNKQRRQTIHVKSIAAKRQVNFYSPAVDLSTYTGEEPISFSFKASVSESGKPDFQVLNISIPDNAIAGEASYEVMWFFDDLPQSDNPQRLDVLSLCALQLDKIAAIVAECEQMFTI